MPEICDPIGSATPQANSNRDLDEYASQRRKLNFQEENWFYRVRVGFLLIVSASTVLVTLCYLWHLAAPEAWRWLTPKNVADIKDLALAIIVGLSMTVLTTYFFKRK